MSSANPLVNSVLDEAYDLVHGPRQANYGHPADDFSRTAQMWNAMFDRLLAPGKKFGPEHVAYGMIAVKLSREAHVPKRDNRVDIAGYIETAEMVYERAEALSGGVAAESDDTAAWSVNPLAGV